VTVAGARGDSVLIGEEDAGSNRDLEGTNEDFATRTVATRKDEF